MSITVLVTGVGDTVGQALLKALRMSSIPCRIVGTDRDECSAGLHWVDKSYLLPHCSQAVAYIEKMRAVCAAENVRLIFPGSEKELTLLAQHVFGDAIVVGSRPEVLNIALNKYETCRFLEKAALNFPRYARLDEAERLVKECGFPLIAKPIHGTGARGLSKVNSWKDIEALSGEMVLQEYLQPDEEEYSVEVYTLKNGRQVGSVAYHRKHIVAGDTYKARIVHHEAAQAEAEKAVAALGTFGPCNVQLRVTERGPVTFEINPRFSGGVSLRAHFGYNECEMALRDLALGQEVPAPKVRQGTALRFWEELYLEEPAMRVLETKDDAEWKAVLDRAVQHDFHHLPAYHRVAEGTGHLFVYDEGEYMIALPLLLRRVNDSGWNDATSVYGYCGPIASHESIPGKVVRNFQAKLQQALAERRVVAAFSRLHPLIRQQHLLAGLGQCTAKGQTVSVDLTQPPQYNKSCRQTIRKLRQLGFVGVHDREKRYLPQFVEVYHETMRRAGAHSSYFFDENYFQRLVGELGEAAQLFVALKDGQVAAATLATLCDGIVQDHLGGTRDAFLKFSPDRLVVETEREWAVQMGAHTQHLGGGVGAQVDSVFRYKAAFSDRRHTFYTWQWVLVPEVYRELCAERLQFTQLDGLEMESAEYFPAYRTPATPRILVPAT